MKKLFFSSIVLGLGFSISSCDFVTIPDPPTTASGGTPTIDSSRVRHKVLIEDYTGHKCTACPPAAVTANSIIAANGDSVIVIGVHAGFFSYLTPDASGNPYPTEFRTTAGTAYDTYFGISAVGNPNGMINRKDYTASTTNHIKAYGTWATEVAIELAKPPLVRIKIANNYNATTRALNCDVNSTFLYDTLTGGPYMLVVSVIQDSIISEQIDAGVYTSSYMHRHVLRYNLNGTWGDIIPTGPIVANAVINKNYSYTFPTTYPSAGGASSTTCDANKCYIVAYIYNDATKEIIEVEEAKLIP
jgi:hypothetical protein